MTHPRTSAALHAVRVTCERRSARGCQHGEMVEQHRWPDLPPVPPWVLHDGDAALGSRESLVAGTARVWFTLREKPTVRYEGLTSHRPTRGLRRRQRWSFRSHRGVRCGCRTRGWRGGPQVERLAQQRLHDRAQGRGATLGDSREGMAPRSISCGCTS